MDPIESLDSRPQTCGRFCHRTKKSVGICGIPRLYSLHWIVHWAPDWAVRATVVCFHPSKCGMSQAYMNEQERIKYQLCYQHLDFKIQLKSYGVCISVGQNVKEPNNYSCIFGASSVALIQLSILVVAMWPSCQLDWILLHLLDPLKKIVLAEMLLFIVETSLPIALRDVCVVFECCSLYQELVLIKLMEFSKFTI